MSKTAVDVTERLSKYDKTKLPPESPTKPPKKKQTIKPDQPMNPKAQETVERLTTPDPNYLGPPGSSRGRRQLPFAHIYNRYDYHPGPDPERAGPRLPAAKVDEIFRRLQQDPPARNLPPRPRGPVRSKAEVEEIFSRLQQCNFKKGPPGSSTSKQNLGFNRYDYYDPSNKFYSSNSPRRTEAERQEIVERLSQFDVTKGPPGSRGHEKLTPQA